MNLKEIKNLLKKYNLRPSKRLGQNFLISGSVLQKIIEVANLSKEDLVLEVGPGIGNLTIELAKRAKKVIAIEKDQRMIEILKELTKDFNNIEIIQGDILSLEKFLFPSQYKLVANIPYYLTSPLIRKFLEMKNQPKKMILMVQKEVAQRICAKPPNMNLLAASVQFYSRPEILFYVSKNAFWPSPKVDSAVIKIVPKKISRKLADINLFFKIVKAGFSQPRKQLINNFVKKLGNDKIKIRNWLLRNKIQPNQRAQTLKIEDWKRLTKNFRTEWKQKIFQFY